MNKNKIKTTAKDVLYSNAVNNISVSIIIVATILIYSVFNLLFDSLIRMFNINFYQIEPFKNFNYLINYNYLKSGIVFLMSLFIPVLIFSPIKVGASKWFFTSLDKQQKSAIDIFEYFSGGKAFFGSIFLEISLFLRKLFFTFILTLLPIAVIVSGYYIFNSTAYFSAAICNLVGNMLVILGFVLLICASIILWIFLKRYFLVRYLYVSGYKHNQAFKLSKKLCKGRKTDLFLLDLSFFFWGIACIFVIPIVYVLPYYNLTIALYAKLIINKYTRSLEQTEEDNSNNK